MAIPVSDNSSQPVVVLVDTVEGDWAIENLQYLASFYKSLKNHCRLKRCRNRDQLLTLLHDTPAPQAILVAEPEIIKNSKYSHFLDILVEYIMAGGRVVFACQCASFLRPNKWNEFAAQKLKIPWSFGGYHRTTHYLQSNHAAISKNSIPFLEPSYSMKSVMMKGVAPQDRLYQPNETSYTQSMVFASRGADKDESPAALTKLGNGWVGWQGDVNAEVESTNCILAMLGVPLTGEVGRTAKCKSYPTDTFRNNGAIRVAG